MYNVINTNEIYGLRTVNCGEVVELDTCDLVNPMRPLMIEVLRPENHNPYAQIICYYLWDINKRNKIELTVYRLNDGTMGSEIYYFNSKDNLQHHKSYNYPNFNKLPKKYNLYIKNLIPVFKEIFG